MADHEPPETSEERDSENAETVEAAGSGDATGQENAVLPERIRVHALAKLLGVKSKQILATLSEIGAGARSAHSNLDRDVAETVRQTLSGEIAAPATPAPEPASEEPAAVVAAEVPSGPQLFTRLDTAHAHEESDTPEATVQVPLFLQPDAEAVAEERRRRKAQRDAAAAAKAKAAAAEVAEADDAGKPAEAPAAEAPAADSADDASAEAVDAVTADAEATDADGTDAESGSDDENSDDSQPRRRRRGRRGRGRGRGEQQGESDQDNEAEGSDDSAKTESAKGDSEADAAKSDDKKSGKSKADKSGDDNADAEDNASGDDDDDENGSGDGTNRRRRRRRRRKVTGDGSGDSASSEDDPPNTVVHEREPRNKGRANKDEVQGISGSTRLEAKRQRRRDGRDAGRRRPPILTESEFLARREAVDRVMVVREKTFKGSNDAPQAPVTQVAVLEDNILVEHFVTSTSSASMVGNVYLGRVQNVLPSMEAAFVDIGRGRNGVLYAGEVDWDAAGLGGKERKIEQALKPGDQVLVQVSKDPVGHKGARLTTQISLAGRFLVYVPGGSSTGISRKLPDTERKRLKEILREIVPSDAGVIIRTASEGVSEEELARDVERLQSQWRKIEEAAANVRETGGKGNPQTLYEEPDLLVKVVRDLFNEDFSKLVIEGDKAWNTVENYIGTVASDLLPRLSHHESNGGADVFEAHRIDEQLAKALDRKVWLPSGGTLVIDRTEAMTVVDVNTGKFTGAGGNLEETVTRNNLEAAEEIVRQMRLRDIGGMIVVDFIDMVLESNRDLVLRRLTEALGRDRTRHQVSEVTSLGLVQMTRKKLGTGLVEAFSTTCEHCHGRGILVHSYPVEASTSSEDNGSRGGGSRSESTPRKRRGRDKSNANNSNESNAVAPAEHPESEVDASVKRAHPVALAMAHHHDEHGEPIPVDEHAVVEAAPVAPEKSVVDEKPTVETPAVEEAPVAEEPTAPKARSRGRRRVARAAAAPEGETAVGTVFVIPTPTEEEIAQAAKAEEAPAASSETAAPAAPARPRRRRAAGRPAGPPVDVDA